MAGFWNNSFQQLHDLNGRPLIGARAYFYEASTLNPITVYQDYSLAVAHPNPVAANGRGIFPAVFLDEDDEFYRVRITDANGVLVPGTDSPVLPIIGPSGGGGGSEVPVDANALLKTGDFFWQPQSGSRSGFVRANARTIGSATSGAAERANADTELLFLHLWNTYSDTLCPVVGGRGVSAAADWAANKYIGTPNARNKGPMGLPDMGNTDSGAFDSVTFDLGNKTTALSMGGDAMRTLARANLPNTSVPVAVTATDSGHVHSTIVVAGGGPHFGLAAGLNSGASITGNGVANITASGTFNLNGNVTQTDVEIMSPFMLGTWYLKL